MGLDWVQVVGRPLPETNTRVAEGMAELGRTAVYREAGRTAHTFTRWTSARRAVLKPPRAHFLALRAGARSG